MKRSGLFICIIVLLVPVPGLFAQLSQGGIPFSLKYQQQLKKTPEEVILKALNLDRLKGEDKISAQPKDEPWRFGADIYTDLNIAENGVWEQLSNGDRVWRLRIFSPDAVSLNLTFNDFYLPPGTGLYIYNSSGTQILGKFTALNNQDDGYFATSLIFDDNVVLEYYEPEGTPATVRLNLWRVTHGYRDIRKFALSFGSSGFCNVNAACPEGDGLRDQIRSVAMIILGGTACTGTLMNNTLADATPYLLSADHCFSNPGTAVFYFNWQSENCENPVSSPDYMTLSGAQTRARYFNYDMWLMELNDTPPDSFEVFYAGWNRTTTSSLSGMVYGIHHPSADIKKLCWSDAGALADYYLGNSSSPGGSDGYWKVPYWDANTTTEPGSSGSALFDKNLRVIGYLSGGHAACDTIAPDWYGRLGKAWAGGGDPNTRLMDWLDPSGAGVTTLDGHDPLIGKFPVDASLDQILAPRDSYLDTVEITPTVIIRNNGSEDLTQATVSYRLTDSLPVEIDWNGTLQTDETDTIVFAPINLGFGKYGITAKISTAGDENPVNDSITKFFSLVDCGDNLLPIVQGFNNTSSFVCWPRELVNGEDANLSVVAEGQLPECYPTEGERMLEFNSWSVEYGSMRIRSQAFSTEGYENITVSFDWHHDNFWYDSKDRVIIQYSLDGQNWVSIQEVHRVNDTISGWDRKSITMPVQADNARELYCGLLFVSDYGNNCHLDSLVISGMDIDRPYPDFFAEPLEAYVDSVVVFTDASLNGPFSKWEWDFGSGAEPATATGQGPHEVSYPLVGLKSISLTVDDTLTRVKSDYLRIKEGLWPPRNLTATIVGDNNVYLLWDPVKLFSDNFESGDLSKWDSLTPGAGTAGETGGIPYWHASDAYSMDGVFAGVTNWGFDIDTWIITPELNIGDNQILRFNWMGSYYWSVDPNQNCNLMVHFSEDGGNSWQLLWQNTDIGVWDDWTWYETTIDMSSFEGQNILIAFNYQSDDGADVTIDNVFMGDGFFIPGQLTKVREPELFYDPTAKSAPQVLVHAPFRRSSKAAIFSNYTVYRNLVDIGKTTINSFIDSNVPTGDYEYYVTSYYSDPEGESEPSNIVTLSVEVGIENTDILPVSLYPNPGNGNFRLIAGRPYNIRVFSSAGVFLKEFNVQGNADLDLSYLNPGIYVMQFQGKDEFFSYRVVIRK